MALLPNGYGVSLTYKVVSNSVLVVVLVFIFVVVVWSGFVWFCFFKSLWNSPPTHTPSDALRFCTGVSFLMSPVFSLLSPHSLCQAREESAAENMKGKPSPLELEVGRLKVVLVVTLLYPFATKDVG